MHVVEMFAISPGKADLDLFKDRAALCKHNGIVFLVRDNAALAAQVEADGVILNDTASLKTVRTALGNEAIIAVRCGHDIDAARMAVKGSADAVLFGHNDTLPPAAIAAQWSTEHDTPCIIEGLVTNDLAGRYVQTGAGFLDATHYVRGHDAGIMQGTVNMLYAIDLGLAAISRN
jgi:thiamine-phosphate pyrophosphorylase